MTRRSELRPGQVFVNPFNESWQLGRVGLDDILVVVDAKNEVGFWRGGKYRVGEVGPALFVEVV
jgi:hypothetical protein